MQDFAGGLLASCFCAREESGPRVESDARVAGGQECRVSYLPVASHQTGWTGAIARPCNLF